MVTRSATCSRPIGTSRSLSVRTSPVTTGVSYPSRNNSQSVELTGSSTRPENNLDANPLSGLDCRCPVIAFLALERVFQDQLGDAMESQPGEGSGAGEEPVPGPGLPGDATSGPSLSAEGPASSGPGDETPDPGVPCDRSPGAGHTGGR